MAVVVDRSILKGEEIDIFRAAIKSPVTRDVYERRLINFLNNLKTTPDEFLSLARNDPSAAERKIIAFAFELKNKSQRGEIAAGTVHNCVKCVRLLLEMNDIYLNWKKISRILPKVRRYALDRIPTTEEIRDILDAADIRGKALTLVLISSGIREGGIESLKVGHYSPVKKDNALLAGRLVVYAGESEQYVAFISLEACNALEKYLQFRREHGEDVRNDSPLFREAFDPIIAAAAPTSSPYCNNNKNQKIDNMTAHAIRQYYNRLLRSIGIRKERKRRHEFSVHSFRKYFKTKAEIGGMKPINVEILMGHSTGISDSYYKPSENELLADYLRVTDLLTVSDENQLRIEVSRLKAESADMDVLKKSYLDMKLDLEKEREERDGRLLFMQEQLGTFIQIMGISDPKEKEKRLAEATARWIDKGMYQP